MITYHLNEAQLQFLRGWCARHQSRPPFGAVLFDTRKIAALPVASKPPLKTLASVRPGDSSGLLIPTSRFDARRHLPPGWAIAGGYANNGHKIENAGKLMLSSLWNYWAVKPDAPLELGIGQLGKRLLKQLSAHDFTL